MTNAKPNAGQPDNPSTDLNLKPNDPLEKWADCYFYAINLAAIPAEGKHPKRLWENLQDGYGADQHEKWWHNDKKRPAAIGFLTGAASSLTDEKGRYALLVVDLDVKNNANGLETWHGWLAAHNNGIDIETWVANTPSGGKHLYFKVPRASCPRNTQTKFKGIDIRGQGGFIMAPPSLSGDGSGQYQWVVAPWDTEIADAPRWLLDELKAKGVVFDTGYGDDAGGSNVIPMRSSKQLKHNGREIWPLPPGVTVNDKGQDAWGNLLEDREAKMTAIALRVCTTAYLTNPATPSPEELEKLKLEAYQTYLGAKPRTRIPQYRTGKIGDHETGLEIEGRGLTEMDDKVGRLWDHWETKVKRLAEERLARGDGLTSNQTTAAIAPTDDAHSTKPDSANNKRFEDLDELLAMKQLSYRIDGLVTEHGVGVIGGSSTDGKSFLALHIGMSIALGRSMHGRKVKQGKVCFCLYEGAAGFGARVLGWLKSHELDTLEVRQIVKQNVKFVRGETLVELTNNTQVDDFKADLVREGITTVFVDTFGKAASVNPNEGSEVRPIFKRMDALATEIEGVVVFIDHFGKDRTRGVTGTQNKKDDADFTLLVSRIGDKRAPLKRVELFVGKLKDGEDGFSLFFNAHKVSVQLEDTKTGDVTKKQTLALHDDIIFKNSKGQLEVLTEILDDYPDGIECKELEKIFIERLQVSDSTFRSVKARALEKKLIRQNADAVVFLEDDFG